MGISIISEDGQVHIYTSSYSQWKRLCDQVRQAQIQSDHVGYQIFTGTGLEGAWTPSECADVLAYFRDMEQDTWSEFCDGLEYCVLHKQHAMIC